MTRILPVLALTLMTATGSLSDRAFAGDSVAGKAKAKAMCQVCHGLYGQATAPMAANLSGQLKEYIIAQLEAYRAGKRRHEQMSIISGMLGDDDIENLAEWYSSIKVTIEIPN